MALRFLSLLFLLFFVFIASRSLIRALPGDPLDTLMAESGTPFSKEILQDSLNLHRPYIQAIIEDLKKFSRGDFGKSLFNQQPIAPIVKMRFLKTAQLTGLSLLLGLILSLIIGLFLPDYFCTFWGAWTISFPIPWIGPVLLSLFAVKIPIFPVGGGLILPALALAIVLSGFWARLIRERVRESLRFGAAPGARARGVPEWKILIKYGLAPVSGSLLAYFGSQVGSLLAGAFVVEVIFDWPGLGSLLIDAVLRRDYPVIEAALFVGAATSLLGTWLGDCGQEIILEKKGGVK
jgi:peptide/nickel transport system permease protein